MGRSVWVVGCQSALYAEPVRIDLRRHDEEGADRQGCSPLSTVVYTG